MSEWLGARLQISFYAGSNPAPRSPMQKVNRHSMFNSEEEQISGRKLSLFCLDEGNERMYLENLAKEVDDEGNLCFRPIFSEESTGAYAFATLSMALKYSKFLKDNLDIDFFYCILPENLVEDEEKITEEEKVVDSTD